MLDFAKLRDPEYQATARREREAAAAAAKALEGIHRGWVNLLFERDDLLDARERSFVRNCQHRLNTYTVLSEPQVKWLTDLARRFGADTGTVLEDRRSDAHRS